MYLASVTEVREQLGFDDMPDINFAIGMALDSAEAILAAAIGTEFQRVQAVDTFFVSEPSYENGSHAETQFRLKYGMVQGTPAIVSAFQRDQLDQGTPLEAMWDLEKGSVTCFEAFRHQYVRVSYTAGFEVQLDNLDKPTNQYNLGQVPKWLQEAAKLKALVFLASAEPIKDAGINIDAKQLDQQVTAIINRKIRYLPLALLAI